MTSCSNRIKEPRYQSRRKEKTKEDKIEEKDEF
jgi:predicted RNA-binding Zn ribbon-like protein